MTLRDQAVRYVPSWLSDGFPENPSNGHRILFVIGRFVDAGLSALMQGALAAVGRGTPTALKYVGQARGVMRGRYDTDAQFQTKLSKWIDRAKRQGSQRQLAVEIAEYLGDARVRVVNRAGHWITCESDGTVTETDAAWDWDSVSHPERNDPDEPWWSDEWVLVYPAWEVRDGTLGDLYGADGFALGHYATSQEIDSVKWIVQHTKAAHSCVRAVIWTSDPDRFDPEVPASCPDGTWGAWGIYDGDSYVPSGRDLTTCRYWEPR